MLNPVPRLSTLPAALADAPTIVSAVTLQRPPQQVFDFVSTPALWHRWHPATRSVREVPMRPLVTGETMLEHIAAAGRSFEALWTVLACEPPQRWVIATDTARGAAHIEYRLSEATATSCRFERTLRFRSKGWPWRALDASLTRWMLQRQSARALANLKRVLEAG